MNDAKEVFTLYLLVESQIKLYSDNLIENNVESMQVIAKLISVEKIRWELLSEVSEIRLVF